MSQSNFILLKKGKLIMWQLGSDRKFRRVLEHSIKWKWKRGRHDHIHTLYQLFRFDFNPVDHTSNANFLESDWIMKRSHFNANHNAKLKFGWKQKEFLINQISSWLSSNFIVNCIGSLLDILDQVFWNTVCQWSTVEG